MQRCVDYTKQIRIICYKFFIANVMDDSRKWTIPFNCLCKSHIQIKRKEEAFQMKGTEQAFCFILFIFVEREIIISP